MFEAGAKTPFPKVSCCGYYLPQPTTPKDPPSGALQLIKALMALATVSPQDAAVIVDVTVTPVDSPPKAGPLAQ